MALRARAKWSSPWGGKLLATSCKLQASSCKRVYYNSKITIVFETL
jgi:hypothetical protein